MASRAVHLTSGTLSASSHLLQDGSLLLREFRHDGLTIRELYLLDLRQFEEESLHRIVPEQARLFHLLLQLHPQDQPDEGHKEKSLHR